MPKFKITYYFDGNGEVEIEAKTAEKAREKFFNGEFRDEEEWGENYNIDKVEKIK
jgi:hypothetical protein